MQNLMKLRTMLVIKSLGPILINCIYNKTEFWMLVFDYMWLLLTPWWSAAR